MTLRKNTDNRNSISGSSDVDFSTLPFDGDVLTYSQGKWTPKAPETSGASSNGETYIVELARWGISVNGTNSVTTTSGINNALLWASQNDYGIVILPKGTYLIDKDSSIKLKSNTHYKFYGCTFVKETNGYVGYEVILLDGIRNTTLEGANILGDRDVHDYTTTAGTHEWGYGVDVKNACYNILVKNCDSHHCTGDAFAVESNFDALGGMQHHVVWMTNTNYALNDIVNVPSLSISYKCTVVGSGKSTIQPTHTTGTVALGDGYSWQYNGTLVGTNFAKGDIDPNTGLLDPTKTNYTTVTKFFDVTGATVQATGYFYYAGDGYGGYGTGINLNKVPIKVHFYAANDTYLGSKTTRTYEFIVLTTMPVGTTKVRFSYLQNYDLLSGNLHFVLCAKMPQYVKFQGCRGFKCRRQGSSVMGGRFITYDFCEFFDIGWATATSPAGSPGFGIDVEDGFMTNQKITVMNSNFYDNKSGAFTCVSTRGVYLENNKFSGYVRLGGSGDDYMSFNNMYYGSINGLSVTSGVEADGTFCTFRNDHIFGSAISITQGGNTLLENCVFSKCTLGTGGETVKIYNCKMTFDSPENTNPIVWGSKNLEIKDTTFDFRRAAGSIGGDAQQAVWKNVKVLTGEASGGIYCTAKELIVEDCQFIHSGTSTTNYSSMIARESMRIENCTFKNLSFRFDGGGLLSTPLNQTGLDSGYTTHFFRNNKIIWDAVSAIPANHEARGQGVGFLYIPRLEVSGNIIDVKGKANLGSLFNLRVYAEKYLKLTNNSIVTTRDAGVTTTSGSITIDYAYRADATANPRPKTLFISDNNSSDALSSITLTSNFNSQLAKPVMGGVPIPSFLSAEPTFGSYVSGELIYNSAPISGGSIGWVCITAGVANKTIWVASTSYAVGTRINANNHVYEVTTSGTSASSAPTWSTTSGANVTDGTVTWKEVGILAAFKEFGLISG